MNPGKEALARLVIAEFETRRKAERAIARGARLRFIFQIGVSLVAIIIAVLIAGHKVEFSARDWIFLACFVVISSGWTNYRLRESVIELKTELDRLQARIAEEQAQPGARDERP